jgi:hypothetical protein
MNPNDQKAPPHVHPNQNAFLKLAQEIKRFDSILGVSLNEKQLTEFVDSCPLPSNGNMGEK